LSKESYNPKKVLNQISWVKSELKQPEDLPEDQDNRAEIFRKIYSRYEDELIKNNAFDFDDLLEKPVRMFLKNKDLLNKYQEKFSHVLVDEYQDINTIQYRLVRLLVGKHQNITVVGDDAQCLPPGTLVATNKGKRKIEDLKKGDSVVSGGGNGDVCEMEITAVKKFTHKGPLVKITTTDGDVLRSTPNHILFIRPDLTAASYFVYLMYRKDKGYRIGLAKSSRWGPRGKRQIGLSVRGNQEKADKMWILRVCSNRAEAEYYEYYYSFTYGIPTLVFDTAGRSMKIGQAYIDKLFSEIDTIGRAETLMEKEMLYFDYPHWLPQGTIRHSAKRLRVRLTLFDDRRKSLASPWGMSRISLNTRDKALRGAIEKCGFKTRKGKNRDWRFECARLRYKDLDKILNAIQKIDADIECVQSACLTKDKRLYFQPAGHARPTMAIAVLRNGKVEEKIIKKVEFEDYDGPVYDLNVENVHNYIANDFVVHNSIYAFRGADFRNFLNFTQDWPKAEVIKLEQNYRSTKNIIGGAGGVINNNKIQNQKELWTDNEEGELIKIIGAEEPDIEAAWVANEVLALQDKNPVSEVAILYRTNAQSRAVEQALISANINYKIYGGLKFYDRKEVKDVLAGIRLVVNPQDTASMGRLEKSMGKRRAKSTMEVMKTLREDTGATDIIKLFVEGGGYMQFLSEKFDNVQERVENIMELIAFSAQFDNLEEFLERISLLESTDRPSGGDKSEKAPIVLMTIHMAKGLEFDYVFLVGANEGLLPHEKSMESEAQVEEERRLMYVAMTRARKVLYILFHSFPSRFLYEIDKDYCEFISPTGNWSELPSDEDVWIE